MKNTTKSIVRELIRIESATLNYSECKELIEAVNTGLDEDYEDFNIDFEGNEYRIIYSGAIDQIQQDELESDLYILGCFNASFLASILDIDQDAIQAIQDAEAFEALGKMVISMGKLGELQEDYKSADGYGHHFAHYDHEEHETAMTDGEFFHMFRTN